jgi:hypothetical protein
LEKTRGLGQHGSSAGTRAGHTWRSVLLSIRPVPDRRSSLFLANIVAAAWLFLLLTDGRLITRNEK